MPGRGIGKLGQADQAIACSEVAPARIHARDTKSYLGVLLDDNNRRPIARLHFNSSQKYVGLFDKQKIETRHPIDTLDEIYRFADHIRATTHLRLNRTRSSAKGIDHAVHKTPD